MFHVLILNRSPEVIEIEMTENGRSVTFGKML